MNRRVWYFVILTVVVLTLLLLFFPFDKIILWQAEKSVEQINIESRESISNLFEDKTNFFIESTTLKKGSTTTASLDISNYKSTKQIFYINILSENKEINVPSWFTYPTKVSVQPLDNVSVQISVHPDEEDSLGDYYFEVLVCAENLTCFGNSQYTHSSDSFSLTLKS